MHTFTATVTRDDLTPPTYYTYSFHFNSDFSGEVRITEPDYQDTLSSDNEARIPGEAIFQLLGYIIEDKLTALVEDTDFADLLRKALQG